MKLNPAEAAAAGEADARSLMAEILTAEEGDNHGELMSDAMAEIIGLAVENRIEECMARLAAFCGITGALLYRSAKIIPLSEESVRLLRESDARCSDAMLRSSDQDRVILAAISACSYVATGRIVAAHQKDDDAAVTLAELQLAVDALDIEQKFTETEGGEL
ncbi:hypothetical protein ACLIKD_06845 [Azonexus sp. IMCC34842]|uniref:hypothetical protein n=1 Tax=Azonexus sp. IMCC34842 TaxID=3420950 RepID=UPI003D151DDF